MTGQPLEGQPLEGQPLRADHAVAYSYRRSAGGATGRFLAGLARAEVWGARHRDGRVVVPPGDADGDDLVRVADTGVVRSWTWVAQPTAEHPLGRPFAFALIQLDGADTSLFHVVDVGEESAMATGMRVFADWRTERIGGIRDIRAFVPTPSEAATTVVEAPEEVEVISEVRLDYGYEPGVVLSRFLRSLGEHRIEAGRCASCAAVYVPPRPGCPACGSGPMTLVDVGDTGVVVAYTVVHVPPPGEPAEVPFAWAWIRLDDADVPFPHLLGEADLDALRVGQRVQAVWVDNEELAPTWASIRHFRPVGR
jgi:uncharacterized OB-fold protein